MRNPIVRRANGLATLLLVMTASGRAEEQPSDASACEQKIASAQSEAQLEKAAAGGATPAMLALGLKHLKKVSPGPRAKYDEMDQAALWFRRAFYAGEKWCALLELGRMRPLLAQFYPEVAGQFREAPDALSVGILLIEKGDRDKGIVALIREADLLSAKAQIALALYYELPVKGYTRYDPRILAWFEKTAAEGLPRSQLSLARAYYSAEGVPEDLAKAEALLEKANQNAELPEAWSLLGNVFSKQKKDEQAESAWKKAGDLGDVDGLYNYAVALRDTKRYKEAFSAFESCLKKKPDYYKAMANLAQMHIEGWGTREDLAVGISLYRKAADEGHLKEAQFIMGLYSLKGIGMKASVEKAREYLRASAEQGFTDAAELLQEIRAGGR